MQPLRQFVLHIRSKDAEREGDLNSHIFVDLLEPITIDAATEEIHQIVLSGEIPYSFYNISPSVQNDTITYNTSSTLVLQPKNYDIGELVRVLTADVNFPFSATYDKYTMKITLTNTSVSPVTINWGSSNSFKILGWTPDTGDQTVAAGASVSSPNVVDLASIHSLFIKANSASSMVFSTRAGFSQTIQKVSVDVNSGSIIYLNSNDSRQHTVVNSNIEALDLKITDQNGNLIDMNDINYELSIGFFVYPINKTRPAQQEVTGTAIRVGTQQRRMLASQAQNNMRPFTPANLVRTQEDVNVVDNEETALEHTGKRLIIDNIIERMQR